MQYCFNEEGEPLFCVDSPEVQPNKEGRYYVVSNMESEYVLLKTYYDFEKTEIVYRGGKPQHHYWDWPTKSWLPNLDEAREAKLQQVAVELNTRLYLPCNGFDADNVARGRISGTIARLQRGDGLPARWLGWRDASNQQRWAEGDAATVLANLITLSRAIEDREQALLIASWQHKANLNALEDFNEILSYDTAAGWPS